MRSPRPDLDALAKRLGRDHGLLHQDVAHLFRCQECVKAGRPGRKVGLTAIPDYAEATRRSWERRGTATERK